MTTAVSVAYSSSSRGRLTMIVNVVVQLATLTSAGATTGASTTRQPKAVVLERFAELAKSIAVDPDVYRRV